MPLIILRNGCAEPFTGNIMIAGNRFTITKSNLATGQYGFKLNIGGSVKFGKHRINSLNMNIIAIEIGMDAKVGTNGPSLSAKINYNRARTFNTAFIKTSWIKRDGDFA